MSDIKTKYLGFELKNPVIVSSSGLTSTKESVKQCEDEGAGAVVLKSVFEEQIMAETKGLISQYDTSYSEEALSYVSRMSLEHTIEDYINLVYDSKKECRIPIIASINCATDKGWMEIAGRLEHAGADALELNIFILPENIDESSEEFENRYIKIIKEVRKLIKIPISVKLTPFFSNFANFSRKLANEGANGIVLFNRFQTVNVNKEDTENAQLKEGKWLSLPDEKEFVKRILSQLYGRIGCDLSATSGFRTGKDILGAVLCGASVVQIASVLYLKGYSHIKTIINELEKEINTFKGKKLMDLKGINSIEMNKSLQKVDRLGYFKAISHLNKFRERK
jgi:dihydroorotate dehydrogenase (fumarate)